MEGIIKGKRCRPRRVLNYGTHGIGKSTWAAGAPSPLVIATEDGLDDVGVDRTPICTETLEVGKWLIALSGEDQSHGYRTVVIDSLDWLEKLIHQATCKEAEKKSIEDFGYGKGYVIAARRWERLLAMLDGCRAVGLNVVLLAHAKIERFAPPDAEAYDRWAPDLHKTVAPMIQEWADEVLFSTYRINTVTREEGFGQKRTRAVGSGDRIVYTSETPTHAAKRRIELPDTLPLEWAEYQKHWPTETKAGGNIDKLVTDGHSKQKGPKK